MLGDADSEGISCNLHTVAMKKLDSIVGHVRRVKQSFIGGLYSDSVLIFLNTHTWSKWFSKINLQKMNKISEISEN